MFAERVYHFNGIYSREKFPMCEGWGENFGLKGVYLEQETKQLDDLLSQYHNWFLDQSSSHILVECCFSKKYLVA